MSSQTFSTFSEVGMIDARSQNGTITLPLSTDIPYRILTLKDIYGAATVSSITLTTQGADVFEDGTTSRLLNGAFETTTLYAGQAGFWYVTGGSRLATAAIGTLSTGIIQNPLRLGTLSTQTAIQFPGLRSNYTGTVIAGQGTGVGTQELLLYQASSISDQIRLQTTGNIVFEAGAGSRSWPSTAALVTPTLYIAGSTSNVGIGTASPATTLDVAGAGRFQTLSTIAMNVSSINGIVPGAAFIGSTNFISATTVQALTISTQSINVSSVNGILPGAAFNGSTIGLSSATINTSSLITNSLIAQKTSLTATTATFAGLTTSNLYGTNYDTLTLQAPVSGGGGGIVSMYMGSIGSLNYPFARIAAIGAASAGESPATALLFQTTLPSTITTTPLTYPYTDADQFFTVPANVTSITVSLWGAGGGGNIYTFNGGGGAYVSGVLSVTPGQVLKLITGQGGSFNSSTSYGGGGASGGGNNTSGGGRSAIQLMSSNVVTGASSSGTAITYTTNVAQTLQTGIGVIVSGLTTSAFNISGLVASVLSPTSFTINSTATGTTVTGGSGTLAIELVDAGAGGGAGFSGGAAFAGNGGLTTGGTGQDGTPAYSYGGTQTAGGGASAGTPIPGSIFTGGTPQSGTGGGGAGFFGGAGGTSSSRSGGGGSSYTSYSGFTVVSSSAGNALTPVGTSDITYVSGIGVGGIPTGTPSGTGGPGGNGYIAIIPPTQNVLTETMRISKDGYLGIGTSSPQTLLHVSGMTYSIALSTQALTVSTINGQTFGAPIQSSIIGLGTAGYISSTQLTSTVTGLAFTGSTVGLSAATIGVSTINIISLSSVQGYISSFRTDSLTVGGPTGYVTIQDLTTGTVSTGQLVAGAGFISSLQINTLSFGPSGYVIVGDVIANSLSTTRLNTQALYTNNLYVGNTSTQSAILFPGIDGNFRGTAIAEQVTGIGTEELLLYKVSTTSDQIRLQTTGNIVFEAGASARSWPSTAALATPTLYIAGSTSNVGVGTAAPATTLDVAGTGRFQVVSSYALNVSSINGIIPGAAFNGSTMALSTGSITTNSLQAYSYVNMTGGVFSNVATEYFTTPKYTTTFTPASIAGLKVWLDASKTTSITSNGSGQVLSLSNLTGLGNATQGTPSSAPLTGQYTFNNLNVLSNSFNTQLVLPSINYTSQYRTAFLVLQAPYYSAWIGANRSTDSIGMWSYGDLEIETAASWIALTSFPSNAQNIPIIIDIHSSAASNGVYMNGSNLGSLLRTFATGSFTDTIGLGGTGTPLGGYYGGSWYFGEFIYYDAELTVSQRQTVEGYLAWKWGTQGLLAPTHPSYSSPPPPLGIVYLPAGSVGTDATSNLTIQATINTKISLAANTQITGLLTTSTIGVSNITATYANISSLSTQALIVSSINNSTTTQLVGAPIQSTVIGLGTAGYISTQQLAATSNYFKNLLFLDVSTSVSTATLYTSNTSNWSRNLLQDFSTPVSSVATAVGATSNYFQNLLALNVSSAISTATLFTSNTSNFILSTNQSSISTAFVTAIQGYISSLVVDSLAIGSNSGFINIGDVIATSLSTLQLNTGLLTASGTVSAPELIVSSINGLPLLTLANLTSTVTGTNSNISSMIDPAELTSTVTGLGTANFISSVGLTTILNSTVTGVNTTIAAMIDPVELASSITGLGTTGFISSLGLDAMFASTTANLGTAGYLSSSQLLSTVQGLGSAGYASTSYVVGQISSFSTAMGRLSATFTGSTIFLSAATIQASNISSFQITAQNITTQALSTNALIFGTGTGTLLMPDIAPNTIYTSTVTTSNLQIGWTSNQSPLQFYGFGTYSNTVIVEQSTGTTTQELFVFRGSNAADRIRFQTTGYMAIETGVSSRLYTAALSNAVPAVMIDINSNVGIRLAAPAVPLDVGGTIRAPTLSSLTLQTSTIEGAIFTRDLYANARTFLQGEVSTSFLLGNYNTLSFRTAGTQRATFTQAGNLGIGIAAPQFPVDIAGITRVSTIYNSTSISYNFISAPLLVASTVNTENAQITNISTNQINASLIYGRWNDAQYYVLQTL